MDALATEETLRLLIEKISGGDKELEAVLGDLGTSSGTVSKEEHLKRLVFLEVTGVTGKKLWKACSRAKNNQEIVDEIDLIIEQNEDSLRKEKPQLEERAHKGFKPAQDVIKTLRKWFLEENAAKRADIPSAVLDENMKLFYAKAILLGYVGRKFLEKLNSESVEGCRGNVVVFVNRIDVEFRHEFMYDNPALVKKQFLKLRWVDFDSLTRDEMRAKVVLIEKREDEEAYNALATAIVNIVSHIMLHRVSMDWSIFLQKLVVHGPTGQAMVEFFMKDCGQDILGFVEACERRYHHGEKMKIYNEFAMRIADVSESGAPFPLIHKQIEMRLRTEVYRFRKMDQGWDTWLKNLNTAISALVCENSQLMTLRMLLQTCRLYSRIFNPKRFPHKLCTRYAKGVFEEFCEDGTSSDNAYSRIVKLYVAREKKRRRENKERRKKGEPQLNSVLWDIKHACVLCLLVSTTDDLFAIMATLFNSNFASMRLDV